MNGPTHTDEQGREFYNLTEKTCDGCGKRWGEVGGPWTTLHNQDFCNHCWKKNKEEVLEVKNKFVKVSVSGGVLSVDTLPPGVEIEITENDNGEVYDVVFDPKQNRPVEVVISRFDPKR